MSANTIVFTKREKTVLLVIKSGFAFLWGITNVITFLQSGRFATLMTGNLVVLGLQTQAWDLEGVALTVVLIIAYILGGASYYALSIVVENERKVLRIVLPTGMIMAVLADVIQYMDQRCIGNCYFHLYNLAPLSFLTGMIASGYCAAHPDGVNTTAMTGHIAVLPKALLEMYLPGEGGATVSGTERSKLKEKALTSVVIISAFFSGTFVGTLAEDHITKKSAKGQFSLLFTLLGGLTVFFCILHSQFCRKFFKYHLKKQKDSILNCELALSCHARGKASVREEEEPAEGDDK